jgi:hypothetical protein
MNAMTKRFFSNHNIKLHFKEENGQWHNMICTTTFSVQNLSASNQIQKNYDILQNTIK